MANPISNQYATSDPALGVVANKMVCVEKELIKLNKATSSQKEAHTVLLTSGGVATWSKPVGCVFFEFTVVATGTVTADGKDVNFLNYKASFASDNLDGKEYIITVGTTAKVIVNYILA